MSILSLKQLMITAIKAAQNHFSLPPLHLNLFPITHTKLGKQFVLVSIFLIMLCKL